MLAAFRITSEPGTANTAGPRHDVPGLLWSSAGGISGVWSKQIAFPKGKSDVAAVENGLISAHDTVVIGLGA
jgi:hypothetical protein